MFVILFGLFDVLTTVLALVLFLWIILLIPIDLVNYSCLLRSFLLIIEFWYIVVLGFLARRDSEFYPLNV